jgi:hypothetical protein
LAKVKDLDAPISPGAERGSVSLNEYMVLEKRNVESPTKRRMYMPIAANVVSAPLDSLTAEVSLSKNFLGFCPVVDISFVMPGLLVCMSG